MENVNDTNIDESQVVYRSQHEERRKVYEEIPLENAEHTAGEMSSQPKEGEVSDSPENDDVPKAERRDAVEGFVI